MKKIILIAFTIGLFQNGFSQFAFNNVPFKLKNPPSDSYKIIQTRNGEITKIEEINENGNVIFQYIQGDIPPFFNWNEPHRFIYAFEFNRRGDKTRRYAFNSNAGHNIYEYEYDYDKNLKTTYERGYSVPEKSKNSNAFSKISRIQDFKSLVESSEVLSMTNSNKDFLEVAFLNESGQPSSIKKYSKMYRDSTTTLIEYDHENREILKKIITSSGDVKRKITTKYPDDKTKITAIITYRNGQEISTYKHAEVRDSLNDTKIEYSVRGKELNVRLYKYDNGYPTNIIVYSTEYKNKLIIPITKKFETTAEMKYSYNSDGLLEKEEMNNYKTGENKTRVYTYRIEYEQ
ncbi:hypothetical protein [Marinifilum caeruleilacunae]|uniref:YD repeat-containing protein n=1 Tax=Marinifilum caeruleilacunae TaxID=2499076 RepID=A0ABX1X1K0_9BACT|nr:hypothetical protein [Marinifilum caeruleilacunae]NOU62295.1 hypothetical protein [Marinifilum caeruleilacunae]